MDDTDKRVFPSTKDVPAEAWQKLAQKKIYFGHQSVGENILQGISDVMKDNPNIKINIVKTRSVNDLKVPSLAHSGIGKNIDPKSKCDDFIDIMQTGMGNWVEMAFLKFCFVDIFQTTDVTRLFNEYKNAISQMKKTYPTVSFIHVTAPLTVLQKGPKAWVKTILGRPISGREDNIKRNEFNELLKKEYANKEPIFDLAEIEATFPDGSKAFAEYGGKKYPRLVPEYTYDDGHLNELGRKIVAQQFLIFLANLANK